MDTENIIASLILGLTSIGLSIAFFIRSHRMERDRMMNELFMHFNRRYDALSGYLQQVKDNFAQPEALARAPELRNRVIEFFNLCAEEYFWYRHKKRVDPKVWRSWHTGMNSWYWDVPAIQALWQEETRQPGGRVAYYLEDGEGFFEE